MYTNVNYEEKKEDENVPFRLLDKFGDISQQESSIVSDGQLIELIQRAVD